MAGRHVPAALPSPGVVFLPPLPSVSSLPLSPSESWSLLGSDSCGLSPGSWALEPGGPGGCPLPARPGLRPASPCPACGQERRPGAPPCVGGGPLLRAGSVPLCCLVVLGSLPSGFPTSHLPRLLQWPGAGPGGWVRASAGGAPRPPWRMQC